MLTFSGVGPWPPALLLETVLAAVHAFALFRVSEFGFRVWKPFPQRYLRLPHVCVCVCIYDTGLDHLTDVVADLRIGNHFEVLL